MLFVTCFVLGFPSTQPHAHAFLQAHYLRIVAKMKVDNYQALSLN